MKRNTLLAIVALSLVTGCASSSAAGERYSVVPKVDVTERVAKKRTAKVSYQGRPEQSPLSGSGGSAR
jgi:predicted component of type VI protein secretion system